MSYNENFYPMLADELMGMDEGERTVAIFALTMEQFRDLNTYLDAERKFQFSVLKGIVRGKKLTFDRKA